MGGGGVLHSGGHSHWLDSLNKKGAVSSAFFIFPSGLSTADKIDDKANNGQSQEDEQQDSSDFHRQSRYAAGTEDVSYNR